MDTLTQAARSANMAKIRAKNTTPELQVRRRLHALGYRYRLHDRRLPGKPDLVFAGRRKVIFVNGCFWHGHDCPRGERLPKSNREYWASKRERNRERDVLQRRELIELGWDYLDIWECDLRDADRYLTKIRAYLDS